VWASSPKIPSSPHLKSIKKPPSGEEKGRGAGFLACPARVRVTFWPPKK